MTHNLANSPVNGNVNFNPRQISLFALALCTALGFPLQGHAQTESATAATAPVVMPQYSSITSTDGVIQVSRLPVTSNGKAYYVDLTLDLTAEVSSTGVVTIAATPTTVASPALVVNSFKAGTYVGPANIDSGLMEITVSGPSALPNGGTGWTLSTSNGGSPYTYPSTAVWYVEPIAANPLAPRLSAAKITSPDYSYGLGDGWGPANSLMGFQQVGNALSLSRFTNGETDSATPVDTVTYTLKN